MFQSEGSSTAKELEREQLLRFQWLCQTAHNQSGKYHADRREFIRRHWIITAEHKMQMKNLSLLQNE